MLTAADIVSDQEVYEPMCGDAVMSAAATPVPRSLKKVIRHTDARNVTFQPPMRENW